MKKSLEQQEAELEERRKSFLEERRLWEMQHRVDNDKEWVDARNHFVCRGNNSCRVSCENTRLLLASTCVIISGCLRVINSYWEKGQMFHLCNGVMFQWVGITIHQVCCCLSPCINHSIESSLHGSGFFHRKSCIAPISCPPRFVSHFVHGMIALPRVWNESRFFRIVKKCPWVILCGTGWRHVYMCINGYCCE